jgi:small subunit ribosomal protein S5
LAFAALVVVGDGKGRVGFGTGKAKEVGDARNKALENAKRSMIRVPLKEGRTIHHDCEGKFGCGHVILRPAAAGTGIISGGPMRSIFECLGVQDVVSKSLGTNNSYGMVLATFEALRGTNSPRNVADRRSKHVSEIVRRRNIVAKGAPDTESASSDELAGGVDTFRTEDEYGSADAAGYGDTQAETVNTDDNGIVYDGYYVGDSGAHSNEAGGAAETGDYGDGVDHAAEI